MSRSRTLSSCAKRSATNLALWLSIQRSSTTYSRPSPIPRGERCWPAGLGAGERRRAGEAVRHGAAVVHEAHPPPRGPRDGSGRARPAGSGPARSRRKSFAVVETWLDEQREIWRTAPTGSSISSPPPKTRRGPNDRRPQPRSRPQHHPRHPRAALGDLGAWTDPDRFEQWWVPAPEICRVREMDLRPGGSFRTEISQDGARSPLTSPAASSPSTSSSASSSPTRSSPAGDPRNRPS